MWQTVWVIAGMRFNTKEGEKNVMSPHAYEVLQSYVMAEQQEAMAKMLGNMYGFRIG